MRRRSPDAGRRRVVRARRQCEGCTPGIAPLSTAGLLAVAVMAMGATAAPETLRGVAEAMSDIQAPSAQARTEA
ncbi:hypothetical protein [Pseudoxanthomonas sp. Root630]|uniref:hypothetical protein n=1 Tax=Pseudoxanthomonas sp. Root630 TaxID=1736574 RepID=UPI000A91C62B|nr:hypothetical protein [Pseudoxanthomonas sp. Root630]